MQFSSLQLVGSLWVPEMASVMGHGVMGPGDGFGHGSWVMGSWVSVSCSRFLLLGRRLSLVLIVIVLFITSLFVDPSTRGGSNGPILGAVLPIILLAVRALVAVIPNPITSTFNNVCRGRPVRDVIGSVLDVNALVMFLVTRR